MLKVRLDYFKQNGKWYTEAEFETEHKPLLEIWDEIIEKLVSGDPPGLVNWHNDFMVLVNVPEHEHAHPYIIMPTDRTSTLNGLHK